MEKRIQNVGLSEYSAIHSWLRINFGKATICENPVCDRESINYQWAKKKEGVYEKKRENFIQLCRKCHAKYDVPVDIWDKLVRSGNGLTVRNSKATHCKQGHPLFGRNLMTLPASETRKERRQCRTCRRESFKKWRKKTIENGERCTSHHLLVDKNKPCEKCRLLRIIKYLKAKQ